MTRPGVRRRYDGRVDVTLSERSLERIREKVESGSFADADAVIEQALALLDEREREYGEWLRAEVAKAKDHPRAGETVLYDHAFRACLWAIIDSKTER